jgi:hypothetical protein
VDNLLDMDKVSFEKYLKGVIASLGLSPQSFGVWKLGGYTHVLEKIALNAWLQEISVKDERFLLCRKFQHLRSNNLDVENIWFLRGQTDSYFSQRHYKEKLSEAEAALQTFKE